LVKINTDEAPGTTRMYGVSSLPADVVTMPGGRLVSHMASPPTASQYIAQLNQAAAGHRELMRKTADQMPGGPAAGAPASAMATAPPVNPAALGAPVAGAPVSGAPMTPGVSPTAVAATPPPVDRYANQTVAPQTPPVDPVAGQPIAAQPPVVDPYANQSVTPQAAYNDRYSEYFNQPQSAPAPGAPNVPTQGGNVAAAPQMAAAVPTAPPAAAPAAAAPMAAPPAAPAPGQPYNPQTYNATASYQQAPPLPQLPPGCPPVGLDGNCPVTLVENMQWALGDKTWGAVHRGRTYLFRGPQQREKFLANPDMYAPVMSGIDPVLAMDNQMTVPGRREFGVFGADRRIYLFADEASLKRFEQNPNRYAAEAVQARR
jgi:YHS domain-containing protein